MSISGSFLSAVQVSKTGNGHSITGLYEQQLGGSFEPNVITQPNQTDQFVTFFQQFVESSSLKGRVVKLCLDRQWVQLRHITIETGLSENELQKHVEWEVEQILLAERDCVNAGYEILPGSNPSNQILSVVLIRKKAVDFLLNIFQQNGMTLSEINIDLFSFLKVFPYLQANGTAIIVKFTPTFLYFSLFNDNFFLTDSLLSNDEKSYWVGDENRRAVLINDEIVHLLNKAGLENNMINHIYFVGPNADFECMPYLKRLQNETDIKLANPFVNISNQLDENTQKSLEEHPEKLMESLGAALL